MEFIVFHRHNLFLLRVQCNYRCKMGDAQKRAGNISRMSAYFESDNFQNADLVDLETRLERLVDLFKVFSEEHDKCVNQTVDTDQEAIDLNRKLMADTEDMYLEMKAKLVRKIRSITNPPLPMQPQAEQTPPASPNVNRSNTISASADLANLTVTIAN